jgi:hypothetical protein
MAASARSGGSATESGDAGSSGGMGGSGRGEADSTTNCADGTERGKTGGGVSLRGGEIGGGTIDGGIDGQDRGERSSPPPSTSLQHLLVLLASGDAISGGDGGSGMRAGSVEMSPPT